MSSIAAAYLRVSTEDQAEYSPDAQLRALRDYAARNGLAIPDALVFSDAGISGRSAAKRPAFQRMIRAARAKDRAFDTILVHKWDRFARSREDSIVYKSLLQREGVQVISVTETIDDGGSGMGMLMEAITEAYAEFYSINLGREVKKGMTERARRGELQATPSFGYRLVDHVLTPDPEEAPIVRKIFADWCAGGKLGAMAKELNAQGVRTHRGNPFENRTVEYILRNPVYIGKLRWNPNGKSRRKFDAPGVILADAAHEPLITREVWDAAQKRLDEQKARLPYKAQPTYRLKDWMGGVVRCADCGSTLIYQQPRYMICNNYVRGRCLHRNMIRLDDLHEAVLDRLRSDVSRAAELQLVVVPRAGRQADEAEQLTRQIAASERKLARARDAYLEGAESLADYKLIKDALDQELMELRGKLAAASTADEAQAADLLGAGIRAALETLEDPSATLEQKHDAILAVCDRVTWSRTTRELTIFYRVIL